MNREAPVPAPGLNRASDLITALRDRAPGLALALAAAQAAWPLSEKMRARVRERATYTVKVPGGDDVYDELHEWVLGLLPEREQRALVAWSSKRGQMIDEPGRHAPPPALRLRYDGTREQRIPVGPHKVRVIVSDRSGDDENGRWKPPEIIFTASSPAARQALLAEIGGVLARSHQTRSRPAFRMLGHWGDWERLDDLPPRDPDSVVLPAGQMERLTADVGRFLAAEADYARRCVPWHRGHLYEGAAGTGKTSVARAIASHFGMDVWYLPLADVRKDGDLLRLAGRVSPRSMLLLEDVDVFHAATMRDDDAEVTLSGLLNALDGIATPHGLLTVLTTNSPEVLDQAVIRPGRVDLTEHFALAGPGEVSRLMSRWYGRPVPCAGIADLAPSEVIEACKRHDDPAAALAAMAAAAVLVTA